MAIVNGDNSDNVLVGTPAEDIITPRGGKDTITTDGDNDEIRLGSAIERLAARLD